MEVKIRHKGIEIMKEYLRIKIWVLKRSKRTIQKVTHQGGGRTKCDVCGEGEE